MSECRKNPPKVLQVTCCDQPTLFHLVEIPASVGDETTIPPVPGLYRNVLLVYESSGNGYIYTSDGMPVKVKDQQELETLRVMLEEEILDRENADEAIWDEIEKIELSSDVVDIVGTYADLQSYDTTNLQDNDIIKVLQDETHDGAISYYRWNKTTQTFSYVGEEGPYYTQTQTDTLLAGKQDKLIAGNNIQIAADGKTISATDTTYTAGTNVQISAGNVISATDTTYSDFTGSTRYAAGAAGLVPAPAAGDYTKYLSGDGTWKSSVTVFYYNYSDDPAASTLYSDSAMTTAVKGGVVEAAFDRGKVIICCKIRGQGDKYVEVTSIEYYQWDPEGFHVVLAMAEGAYSTDCFYYEDPYTTTCSRRTTTLQRPLIAGANISIINGPNGPTISATDTTYSAFTGATSSVAGSAGLVPAPTTSDVDKYLKGDGTWGAVADSGLVELSYGNSTWNDFITAYQANKIVYCRASANPDPATGAQTRKAFMAYVSNEPNPTSVVFQYIRSVGSKSDSQQCDQVIAYRLANTSGGTWTVETRNIAPKIIAGTGMTSTFTTGANATITISADTMTGATSSAAGTSGLVPTPAAGDNAKFLKGDGTWGAVTTNALLIKEWS